MGLESVAYATQFVLSNPANTDQRKQGDDHLRLIKTGTRQSFILLGGGLTTGGTSTALTVTTGHVNSPSYQDGHLYTVGLHTTIGVSATINYDAIGARTLKKRSAGSWVDVAAGDYVAGDILLMYYEAGDSTMRIITAASDKYASLTTANIFTAAQTIRLSDDTNAAGPQLILDRLSTTPAVNDLIGVLPFAGRDSGGNVTTYAQLAGFITDPTDGSEDGGIAIQTVTAGSITTKLSIGATSVDVTGPLNVSTVLTAASIGTSGAIGAGTQLSGATLVVGDSAFTQFISSSNPVQQWDSTDITFYSRSGNQLINQVGGFSRWEVNGSQNKSHQALVPGTDNTYTLGTGALRWSEVFAAIGAINTSDGREKDQIADLDAAELRVARRMLRLVRGYKIRASIARKGARAARRHVGLVAQDVKAAFEAEGLDGFDYGVLCSDELTEPRLVTDEKGESELRPVPTGEYIMGLRYDEAFSFMMAALADAVLPAEAR